MKATINLVIDNIESYGDFENLTIPEIEQVVRIQIEDGDIDLSDEELTVIVG